MDGIGPNLISAFSQHMRLLENQVRPNLMRKEADSAYSMKFEWSDSIYFAHSMKINNFFFAFEPMFQLLSSFVYSSLAHTLHQILGVLKFKRVKQLAKKDEKKTEKEEISSIHFTKIEPFSTTDTVHYFGCGGTLHIWINFGNTHDTQQSFFVVFVHKHT